MKRREFLTKTSVGTAGVILGTSAFSLASCKGANDKVVVALIGCGGRGRGITVNMCKLNKNVEIKYACDVNDDNADRFVAQVENDLGYKIIKTREMKKVFDDRDVDAVVIATPGHWHALATVWACQAGKDVYVEKCPSRTIWEGRKIIEAAEKYKRIVQIGFQNRSAPYAYTARDYIKSGKMGPVVHVKTYGMLPGGKWEPKPDADVPAGLDWDAWLGPAPYRPYNPGVHSMSSRGGWGDFWDFGGEILSDDGSHVLDLARLALSDPGNPKSVYSWSGNHVWGSERETPEFQSITYDFGTFSLTMDTGYCTNYMKKIPTNIRMDPTLFPDWRTYSSRIEIYGTEGLMYLGRHGGGWQVKGVDSVVIAQEGGVHPDPEHQINFIECIRSRRKPYGDPVQGHLSATLVHMANIACRVGNKHLYYDGENERFTNNDEANKLLKPSYRDNYRIPERV